ncbi:hypothetical protein K0M31_011104 [Melipona bicolor]|uniref:Uncharacterized protein n=1 Tax=Melipona bicolor TaxID=60889 RepID=A0AA40G8V8_9HYME|nr:hypothetical protein K0M31_011104 [Melipona bicolor]
MKSKQNLLHDHSYSTAYAASIPTLFANNSMDTLMICDQGTASSLAIANNVQAVEPIKEQCSRTRRICKLVPRTLLCYGGTLLLENP